MRSNVWPVNRACQVREERVDWIFTSTPSDLAVLTMRCQMPFVTALSKEWSERESHEIGAIVAGLSHALAWGDNLVGAILTERLGNVQAPVTIENVGG